MNKKNLKLQKRHQFKIRLLLWAAAAILLTPLFVLAQDDEDEKFISPVRPSVSESAQIQKKGVLQIEYGGGLDVQKGERFRA